MRGRDRCRAAGTLVVSLIAVLLSLAAAQGPTLSGTAVIMEQNIPSGGDRTIVYLVTKQKKKVLLTFKDPSQLDGVYTGTPIEVAGQWEARTANDPSTPRFIVDRLTASIPAPIPPVEYTQPSSWPAADTTAAETTVVPADPTYSTNKVLSSSLAVVVIPLVGVTTTRYGGWPASGSTTCRGISPSPTDLTGVRNTLFRELNGGATTVGSTFNDCSYGRTQMPMANSFVTNFVHLPCTGTSWGVPWNVSNCEFDDYNGMADEADRIMIEERGWNLDSFKHRVYLLPPGPCKFSGMSFIGCDGSFTCRAWIAGSEWQTPQVYVHELSHNLYLQHAGNLRTDGSFFEYGDGTCYMGYSPTNRCPNTAHAWQLGWLTVQQINGASLPKGSTFTTRLMAQSRGTGTTNLPSWVPGLKIVPDWATSNAPIYFGYRNRVNADAELDWDFNNEVHVYFSWIAHWKDAKFTTIRGSIPPNGCWSHAGTGLVVRRLANTAANVAVITVYRKSDADVFSAIDCI